MKIKKLFLGAFTTALSFGLVYSAGLAGTCGDGPTPCTLNDLGPVIKGALKFLMLLAGLAITLAFIQTGIAFLRASDKSQAWKEAKERLTRVVIGMLLITVAVSITGYIALLQVAGVGGDVLQIVKSFFGIAFETLSPVSHAYAQTATLPNPIPGANNLYDFLVLLINLFVKWFVFPTLVVAWVVTGFKYVSAQGNPEKLTEAHKYLWYTLIGTVIIMLAQGFALALSGTISQIFS